jgi:SAM-dependent methyltransferase
VAESVKYIEDVVADYRYYGGITEFCGRVAELGPGDNCGVALLLVADGCKHVDLVDRYHSHRDVQQQAAIYGRLAHRHERLRTLLAGVNLEDEMSFPGICRFHGARAAAEEFFLDHRGYDCIVSRAVGEHLYDPVSALRRMAAALNPGGLLLHKIDLRDHEMLSLAHHELKWLEVPDWFFPHMTRASGRPNRVLAHEYRRVAEECGLGYRLLITHLAGHGDIVPHLEYDAIDIEIRTRAEQYVEHHRRRFAQSLRGLEARDLATTGIFLVARKPR